MTLTQLARRPALHVVIPGDPCGAMRPRAVSIGGHARVHTHARHGRSEAYLVEHLVQGLPPDHVALDEPVSVLIRTYHARPKRLQRRADEGVAAWYTGKPDADNVAKLVMDAATKAGVWVDDTRVAVLTVERRYVGHPSAPGDVPRVELTLWRTA